MKEDPVLDGKQRWLAYKGFCDMQILELAENVDLCTPHLPTS